ncbi:TonB-linked SusC/RagA family outer membrane protein [Arcticibacter tournemirensis]|uniref:TonB-dependent receptor n=1 Tax=Arcticibacter tournemirensis TaxID=699437 RepID=A0A5M9GXG1_9SPHI|nr:TonB-dependent receptor [Arcticibacter tournemirensis]KAA8478445.1 TonB-dependent receptor [Arcticibacter tournemirensis]TQM48563.1 TonB-linked SusC/RagA family outer membrane protein [Arcticibacter tournemirensis]
MKKSLTKICIGVLLHICFCIYGTGTYAQDTRSVVSGTVVDANNEAIIGASVKENGTASGTMTDINGRFSLKVSSMNATLTISYIGYKAKSVPIAGKQTLKIVLQESRVDLDEIVVVGYGTQKKVNLTGAVSSVNMKNLENKPVVNVVEALQGTTPGLTIQQSNSMPGSRPAINIRGVNTLNNNDPLVIIDGMQGDIQNVNITDIENISVLKDASSTAIYGSRASNGVILITTKKGIKGKPRIAYDYSYALQTPTFMPDIVDSWVYAELRNEALVNSGRPVQFGADQIRDFRQNGPNSNWMEEIYRSSAPQQSHNLSIAGGNDKTTYLVSAAYLDQASLFQGPDYGLKRGNFRVNLETNVSDRLKFNVLAAYTRNGIKDHAYWTEWLIEQATRMPPIYPIKDENGDYTFPGGSNSNALARLEQGGLRESQNDDLSGILNGEFKIIDGLKLRGMIGAKLYNNRLKENRKAIEGSGDKENRMTNSSQRIQEITSNLILSYDKKFGNHNLSALGGLSYEGNTDNRFSTFRVTDRSPYDIMGGEQTSNTGNQEWQTEWSIYSAFFRLNYNFKEKYLFEFNLRDDASSKFKKGNRSAWFPSASLAWRVSEEDFYPESLKGIMPGAKIRSSIGLVGNNRIGDYQYQANVNVGQGYNFGSNVASVATFDPYNADIKWETTRMFNVGADLDFFSNALSFSADYFINDTYDILVGLPLPGLYGSAAPIQNAGEVRTQGWELSARYNLKTGGVRHTLSATLSDSKNKVSDLKGSYFINGTDVTTIIKEGYPINSYYAYRSDGYFQNADEVAKGPHLAGITPKPGDIRYLDKNGDGIIKDDDDRFVLGNREPRLLYGINYRAEWKNLDFSMFWQGVGQRNVWLRGESVEAFHNNNEGPVFNFHIDRWTPSHPDASYPRLTVGAESANNAAKSNFWIENAAYLRLKNVQLGYTMPAKWTNKLPNSRLRIYATVQNALTFSDMKGGWDPETTDGGGRIYPVNRTYSFGLNLNF